ncbi:MAG: hypothetical protein FWE82_04195, partial [Defluviitaleaceae bacterium]|nr:hypothetical protein [Defluviitaleaceae bacterium]
DMLRRVNDNGGILNMTIGGLTPDGQNAVNDLTYLILEATRELKMKVPNLCLRLTDKSSERLWNFAMDGVSSGQSLPALYNDDVYVPMVKRSGFSQEDANNYTLIGCSQTAVPYTSNLMCAVGLFTPAKMLDLALHNGFDTRQKKQVGIYSGDMTLFDNFEQVFDAYCNQMKYCVQKGVERANFDMRVRKKVLSSSRTLLMPECVERGMGIYEGGCSKYGAHSQIIGLTNTADALTAIKKIVFDEKFCNMAELITALDCNFDGFETLRVKLEAAPKFGNNIEEADNMRVRITRDIYKEITSYPAEMGGTFWAGEVIFIFHMGQGACVGALPDGRKAWAPLADSAGASQGRDTDGITSLFNSCSKLPYDKYYYTSINLNVKFRKILWDEQRQNVTAMFKTFFEMGGGQLQINVVDSEDLKNAMERPDEYRSLIVRVGGFSAYFVQLSKQQQEEIISRTEHAI